MALGFDLYQKAVAVWNAGRHQEALRLFGMVGSGAYPDRLPKEKFVPSPPERPPAAVRPRTSAANRYLEDETTEFSPPPIEDVLQKFRQTFVDFRQPDDESYEKIFKAIQGLYPPERFVLSQDPRYGPGAFAGVENQMEAYGGRLAEHENAIVDIGHKISGIEGELGVRPLTPIERTRRQRLTDRLWELRRERRDIGMDVRGARGDVKRAETVYKHLLGYDFDQSPFGDFERAQMAVIDPGRSHNARIARIEKLRKRLKEEHLPTATARLVTEQLQAAEKDAQVAALRTATSIDRNFLRLIQTGTLPIRDLPGNIFIPQSGELRGTPVHARMVPLKGAASREAQSATKFELGKDAGLAAEAEIVSRPTVELQPLNLVSEATLGQLRVRMSHQPPVPPRQLRAFLDVSHEAGTQFVDPLDLGYHAEAQQRLDTRLTYNIRNAFESGGVQFKEEDRQLLSSMTANERQHMQLLFGRPGQQMQEIPGALASRKRQWVRVGDEAAEFARSPAEAAEELFMGASLYGNRGVSNLAQRASKGWGFNYQKEIRRLFDPKKAGTLTQFDQGIKEALLQAFPELEGFAANEAYGKIREAAERIGVATSSSDYRGMLNTELKRVRDAAAQAKDWYLPIEGYEDFAHPDLSAVELQREAEERADLESRIRFHQQRADRKLLEGKDNARDLDAVEWWRSVRATREYEAERSEALGRDLREAHVRLRDAVTPEEAAEARGRIENLTSVLQGFGLPEHARARTKATVEALRRYMGLPEEAVGPLKASLLGQIGGEELANPFFGTSALDTLNKLNRVAEEGRRLSLTLPSQIEGERAKTFQAIIGARPTFEDGAIGLRYEILDEHVQAAQRLYGMSEAEAVRMVGQGWKGPTITYRFQDLQHAFSAPDPAEMTLVQLRERMAELNVRGRANIIHKEDMVAAVRQSMMGVNGELPSSRHFVEGLVGKAKDEFERFDTFELFGKLYEDEPTPALIQKILVGEAENVLRPPRIRRGMRVNETNVKELISKFGTLVPTDETPAPIRESLAGLRLNDYLWATEPNKVTLTRHEADMQRFTDVTSHFKARMKRKRATLSLMDPNLYDPEWDLGEAGNAYNFYRPVWSSIEERLKQIPGGWNLEDIRTIGQALDKDKFSLTHGEFRQDYTEDEINRWRDQFARYGDEDAQILLRTPEITSPLLASNRVALPGLPEAANVEMGDLFQESYLRHTASSETKRAFGELGVLGSDPDDIIAQAMARHVETLLTVAHEEPIWKKLPGKVQEKLLAHMPIGKPTTPRHLQEAWANQIFKPAVEAAAGEAAAVTPEAVKAAEVVGEAAPKYTRATIKQLREVLGGSNYLKFGALAVGAVAGAGVLHAGLKAHKQDRTEDDIKGPPIMPGGNPYDTPAVSGTNNYVRSGLPGYAPYGNNGVAYQVNARGSYDPAALQARIEAITGGSAYGTVSNSPSNINDREKQLNSLLNNY